MSLSSSNRLSKLKESLLTTDQRATDKRELEPDSIQQKQKAYKMSKADESQSKLRRFETSEYQTTQAMCSHWRPSLSAWCVISCTGLFSVFCLIIGVIATIDAGTIIASEVVEYDYYEGTTDEKKSVCKMENPTDKACKEDAQDRLMSGDCSLVWDGNENTIGAQEWGKECEFYIKIDKDMKAPVYLYYQVDHFFQNHRSYVKSRSFKLEHGTYGPQTADCDPLEYNNTPCIPKLAENTALCNAILVGECSDPANNDSDAKCTAAGGTWTHPDKRCESNNMCEWDATGEEPTSGFKKKLVPCGIAAYSTFNDRFQATVIRTESTEEIEDVTPVPCSDMYKEDYATMVKAEGLEAKLAGYKCYKLCCDDEEIRTYPYPKGWNEGVDGPSSSDEAMKKALMGMFATDNRDGEEGEEGTITKGKKGLWQKGNIAWESDVADKFIYTPWDSEAFSNEGALQRAQSLRAVERCKANCKGASTASSTDCPFEATTSTDALCDDQFKITMPRVDDPDYIVWMRYATTQDFNKLHRVLNFDLKKGDYVKIKAFNYFQLPAYGRKKLFFSTAGNIGGAGVALGVLWIVDGVICSIIAIIFCFAHKYQTKQIEGLIDGILHKAQQKVA